MSERNLSLVLLCLGVGVFALPREDSPRPEEATATRFLRFVEGRPGEGRLETRVASYKRDDGARVDLIAAVHVADGAYYRRLQKRFEGYDALLYEMIKPEGVSPEATDRPDNLLSAFQRGLKNILGLDFQLDAIRYDKPNFVHADMDPETFFRLQKEKGESILSLMWKSWMAQMKAAGEGEGTRQIGFLELFAALASEDSAGALKLLLAREMNDMERIMAGFEGDGKESVIVAERNKVALRVLRESLAAGKKRLGIFYGAGHMPDLENRLVKDLGFRLDRAEWLRAWDIHRGARPQEEKADKDGEKAGPEAEAGSSQAPKAEEVRAF
jgi:hypothetical protein